MRYFTLRSNRIFAAVFVLITMLCGQALGADFTSAETVAAGGTTKSHVTCSSSETSTTGKKIKNVGSQPCVAIGSTADTDPGAYYIQIQADEGYTIDNTLSITGAANGSSAGSLAVLMWRGAYSATSADTCFTVTAPANSSTTQDQISLTFPSGRFRTIRLYKRINYNEGTIGSGASGNSYRIPSSGVSFNVKSISASATAPGPTSVYLQPGTNWKKDNARFAVFYFKNADNTQNGWLDMDEYECATPAYKFYGATIPEGYDRCVFCRMNPATTENNFNDGVKWNQTADLTVPTGDAIYYTVPNDAWDNTDNSKWGSTPLNVCVSGTWLSFAGETLTLTANAPGATHFQWYKAGVEIAGATSAVYEKTCVFEDAGSYTCKAWREAGKEATSDAFVVKVLRIYVNVGRSGSDYGHFDLHNTDPDHNKASGMIFLGEDYSYAFSITDGCGNYYGCNNDPTTGAMWSGNCTDWAMNSSVQCCMRTDNGATYTFIVDYTNMGQPRVSVLYPPDNQAAGYKIYFDNSLVNWSNLHYRIGTTTSTTKEEIFKVPGTDNLYEYTTQEYTNMNAWHVANNCGYSGDGFSIYQTNTDDSYEISKSVTYEGGATRQDLTIVPVGPDSHSTGSDPYNNHCEFYNYTMIPGMKTQNVAITAPENGTITVSYIDPTNTPQAFTSGDRDLAHTCILTITTTPDCGYQNATLTVNGTPFTSGNTYILSGKTTIAATFTEGTHTITYHTDGGTINEVGYPTEYTYGVGATLPTSVTKAGKDFDGWYDNSSLTGSAVTEITTIDCGDKAYWAKWIDEIPKVTYILGSCYVNNGMWTQGGDGKVKAWLFQPGATVAQNTLKETTDISITNAGSTASTYFNTKDITLLDNESYWNTSSGSNRAIKALKVSGGGTITFNLSGMIASQIAFYVFPSSDNAYSIDLTVNGTTTNRPIAAGEQYEWHKFAYKGGNYSGEFSITSNSKESRVVVIVEVPLVTVTFDKNHASATGTMENMSVPKGSTFALEENAYELAGSNFLGWTEDAPGAGLLIADGADYTTEADVTLYAQWEEIIQTTITLDATGAYNRYTSSVVATYNKPMPEIAVLPKRANGYVFDGYYTEPNGGGTQYYTGLGYSVRNWDKTDPTYTLYAKWLEPCDLVPTLTKVSPGVTIWDGQKVDVGVVKLTCEYEVEGITYDLQSVSPVNPINGCTFEYFDEYVHLRGVPAVGNTEVLNIPVTFTMANSCDPARTYTISTSIRIYPAGQKAKIAFIITGTKGGAFNAYSASDASSCDNLVTYLGNYFDITYVNGYASKDEATLATYYDQYDLMVVTDFLNTQEGYTNALGTLIDKKPILSFEAYVAGLSNWHIGSNPKDPKPKVQDMKVLCAGHAIFKNAKYNPGDAEETVVVRADTTVNVLASLSSAEKAKGLQGFTINEAPDFVFLATIEDANNNRDLIVCCERQVTFPARLLLYGINFYEMPNLSKAGKIVMRQMIEYLLMTDETKVADCSLVFDNGAGNSEPGGGDHLWSNPKNWAPGYNIVPTPYHPTRIIAECWVNVDDAHAGSVKINKGRDEHDNVVDGKLIVKPYGGLTIAGLVATVKDTRYASPITIKAEDLLIEADEDNNGAFVYGNKESDVRATVQYYSRGEGARTNSPVWQYMGTPFQSGHSAISMYRDAWMCRWTTASDKTMGGLWQWVENDDVLIPFEGYCITQEAKKTYTFAGKLNAPVTKTLILDNREPDDGFAFVANSWTAPIKIQEMADEDFTNAERAIYIYHTGTYAEWTANGNPAINATSAAVTLPGQYAVIPIHSSPYISGADSVIPAMQGFFVKTSSADAKLKLVYNRTVYDAKYFKTSTQPMRAPSRYGAPELMLLTVLGKTSGGDRVHILERGDFSEEYADGWDGRKIAGDEAAPKLALVKEAGEMAVAALESADEHYLSFRAGQDTEYTFHFEYEGEPIYLYDQFTGEATLIETGNTYTFQATNSTAVKRFLLTKNPPRVPTALENTADRVQNTDQKFIQEGKLFIFHGGVIYDAQGKRVELRKEGAL